MAATMGTVLTAAAIVRFGLLARASFSNAQRLASNARMEQAPTNVGVLVYNADRAPLSSNINSIHNQNRVKVPTLTPGAAALDVNNVLRGTTNSNRPK